MVLHDAYAALRRLGLVANHAAFSTGYLNKGARYFDHLICSRRPPPVAALLCLFVRIKAVADAFAASPSLTAEGSELTKLAGVIWTELEKRSCTLLPMGRKRPAPARLVQGVRLGAGS